ncbi:hypothetical protein GTA08_BOTSDO12278 [Neofusicoccum parvum]|uniref:Uncharacterized protein n=1 Tax=Neofusicoccum parvum TaxID=310453 RepID=A0ACB5S7S2_9PEZI|nr:hypothetical protein GTA08_BOTSDO12278 [Neofusicoccum parvum]
MAPLPTAPTPAQALKKHPPTTLSAGLSHHDTLLHLYTRPFPHATLTHPLATTAPCRTLIRRAWTTYITAQEKLHNSWFHADNYAHLSAAATCPHWSRRAYQKAVYQRFDLAGAALPLFVSAAESVGAALEGGAAAEGGVGTREMEAWRDVRRRFARLDARLGGALASYGERAAVEEALAAKEGARSVGRVTVVATVFVPCTLVWALFSIGGRYAVGEEEHWVPWVVMVSVQMVVLLVWLWFNRCSVKAKVSVRMAKGKKKTKEVIRLARMRQRDEEMGLL